MRFLVVHNYYQRPGGEDVVFESETALLEAHGHEVIRYTATNDDVRKYGSAAMACRTIWNPATVSSIRETIRKARPDLMHVHNAFPLLSPSIYSGAASEGIPVVQTLHNFRLLCPKATFYRDQHVCEDCLGTRTYWPAIVHACYRQSRAATALTALMLTTHSALGTWHHRVSRYIAISEFSKGKFVDAGWPAGKIAVKPNFLLADPGVGTTGGGYALFVGRLSEEKGLATLLEAINRMPQPLHLKIAGDGPLRPSSGNGQACVEWLGHQSREAVVDLMRRAALLVVPSEWYETGVLTIVEAFSVGLPVIASRLGTMAEMVSDGDTGLLFTPGDPQNLSDTIQWALSHPDDMREMARRARLQFERKHSAAASYRTLIQVYSDAMSEAGRHAQ